MNSGGKMDNSPLVSIIIPTLNSEKTIGRCLKSVRDQSYSNIEIIVIDGGSIDKTVEIANSYQANVINLNIANMTKQTNAGFQKANGTYIYRLDSDIVLSTNVVEECFNLCKKEGYDAVSTYWGPDPSISIWAKIRKFEKDCYKYDLYRNVARFFKKDVYITLNGYNESVVAGEDYDLQNRLNKSGYKTSFAEAEGLHLGEPKSIKDIIKKQYHYGKTIKVFFYQNRTNGIIQVSPVRRSLITNWKKFVKHPLMSLGFLTYEFIIYTSALAGLITSYIPIRYIKRQ